MNKKYNPYLIGLGIFTLLFGIFVKLAEHEINPEDFSVPYYASIEATEITKVKPTEATTVTVPETTAEITTERITEKPKTEKPSSRSVSKKTNGKDFRITVYTPSSDGGKWGYATSTGETSEHLKTCAVDPDVIPLGSVVEVNGIKLKAVDTGNKVKGNVVDIFYDGTSSEAQKWIKGFGEYHEVTIIEKEEYCD